MTRKYIQRSREEWKELVKVQAESGLSAPAFCRHAGIKYQSFMTWRKRLTDISASADPVEHPGFIELTVPTNQSVNAAVEKSETDWHIELDLGHGIQLRIARP